MIAAAIPSPLPPRARLRIGSNDLRIRSSFITSIAFSPDGRLIATAEANTAAPRVSLFEVRTGRLVKFISPPDRLSGWVQSVAFSPDQTKLVWGEIGGQVALWDLTRDRLQFREKLHENGVNEVTFSPDGGVLASGGEDGAVHLRQVGDPRVVVQDIETGERQPAQRAFAGLPAGPLPVGPLHLTFTPDGAKLIIGSGSSGTISVWSIKEGQLVRQIENAHGNNQGMNPRLSFVAVTPDGRRILSSGQSTVPFGQTKLTHGPRNVTLTEIRVWNLKTGERIEDLHGGEDHGRGYAVLSRDGRLVAVGDFGSLRILDVATHRPKRTISLPGCPGDRPALSPDGTLVAMAIQNTVGLFEVETGRRFHHHEGSPEGDLEAAAWSPTGDRIVTGHSDGEVRVWEAATGKLIWHQVLSPPLGVLGRNAGSAFVAFSSDGRQVVVAGHRDDPIRYKGGIVAVFDAFSGLRLHETDLKTIRWASLAPDGRTIVVGTSNGSWDDTHLVGIELATGQRRWSNPPEAQKAGFVQLAGMHFQADSTTLEAALKDGDVVRLDAQTGREQSRYLADLPVPEPLKPGRRKRPGLFTAEFSTDGRTMAASSEEWVSVWDVENRAMRKRFQHPNIHGCYIAVAPDGKTIATSDVNYAGDSGEDKIRLYDADSGDLIITLEPDDDRSSVMAFSPDGNKLFTGFHRGTAIVWDVRRPQNAPKLKE